MGSVLCFFPGLLFGRTEMICLSGEKYVQDSLKSFWLLKDNRQEMCRNIACKSKQGMLS